MFQIIMVCTGNICRSPMAAGLLQQRLPERLKGRIRVGSAGCQALHGHPAEPFAVQAMAQLGIDIRSHCARQIGSELARSTDLVLTMENVHRMTVRRMLLWNRARVRLLTDFDPHLLGSEIGDPYGEPLEAYQACIRNMSPCIDGLISWLELDKRLSVDP